MSTELDREALAVLDLAREAEQALPRDPERVRQRVLAAVGVTAAALGASAPAGASSIAPSAPAAAKLAGAGLFGGLKLVGLASVLLVAGAGTYWFSPEKSADRAAAAPTPARVAAVQPASTVPAEAAEPSAPPVVSVDAMPTLEQMRAAAPRAVSNARRTVEAVTRDEAAADSGSGSGSGSGANVAVEGVKVDEEAAEPDAEPAPARASLREDLQLLSQAQQALNAGQAGRTLELTQQMRSGQLSAERAALQVFALCRLGRRDEAVKQAERFRSIAPRSPLLPRVNASCVKP